MSELVNFFQATDSSPEHISFPETKLRGQMTYIRRTDVPTGSMGGRFYALFFDETLNTSLYQEIESETVTVLADKLETLSKEHCGLCWTEDGWKTEGEEGEFFFYVSSHDITDLAKLFRAAANQKLKLVAWY